MSQHLRSAKTYAVAATVGAAAFGLVETAISAYMLITKPSVNSAGIVQTLRRIFWRIAPVQTGFSLVGSVAGGVAAYLSGGQARCFFIAAAAVNSLVLPYTVVVQQPSTMEILNTEPATADVKTEATIQTWISRNYGRIALCFLAAGLFLTGTLKLQKK